ncbi:MAG: 16S rRNA (cytosine(967)-C(5))-methyltransferase RsmB [Thermodesulfovibrio sp.]|nr:16S rRNA (cytosine(967)-C(5))-methyltransferase RsmB [Thermodesulfovibrio sp.]
MVYEKLSPRQKAVKVLSKIFEKGIPLKTLLSDEVVDKFSISDRAFLKELVYGVLRNLYYIDWLLEDFYRNKKLLSQYTINNLRCAIYQLIFMKLPSYAVTNEAVNLEKIFNGKPSVVNAILRNFIRKKPDNFNNLSSIKLNLIQNNKLEYLSLKYSHPKWLIKRWLERFSEEETEALLRANNQKPTFTIAVRPEERNEVADYLNKNGFNTKFTKYAPSGLIIEGQGYEIRNFLQKSNFFWIVQDEASQLACFFLEPKEDSTVLDVCSSPGGKALLTAALMGKGKIICIEKDKRRFKILNENIQRNKKFLPKIQIESIITDIVEWKTTLSFERIILDAPCSSLGVIRRNPDVRYRCNESELIRLSKNQTILLEHVSKFLSKRGILLYAVCSTEPEEGERVIENFLHKFKEFCTINSADSFFKNFYIKKGMIRTFPHKHEMDGFFMARIMLR